MCARNKHINKHSKYHHNRLRKYRRQSGYKQKHVAKALGMKSPSRISKWEKGSALPTFINILKMSILYRTRSDELYIELRKIVAEQLLKYTNKANQKHRDIE